MSLPEEDQLRKRVAFFNPLRLNKFLYYSSAKQVL